MIATSFAHAGDLFLYIHPLRQNIRLRATARALRTLSISFHTFYIYDAPKRIVRGRDLQSNPKTIGRCDQVKRPS